jgi:hypothetical protein
MGEIDHLFFGDEHENGLAGLGAVTIVECLYNYYRRLAKDDEDTM